MPIGAQTSDVTISTAATPTSVATPVTTPTPQTPKPQEGASQAPQTPSGTTGEAPKVEPKTDNFDEIVALERARRKAKKAESSAKETARKAEEFQKAVQSGAWRNDPSILEKMGLDLNDVQQAILMKQLGAEVQKPDPYTEKMQQADQVLAELAKERAEMVRLREAREETEFVVSDLRPLMVSNGDRWETIMRENGGDPNKASAFVFSAMKEAYRLDPNPNNVLTFQEAADLIENRLLEDNYLRMNSQKDNKKLRQKLGLDSGQAVSDASPEKRPPSTENSQMAKTLTNDLTSSIGSKPKAKRKNNVYSRITTPAVEELIAKRLNK